MRQSLTGQPCAGLLLSEPGNPALLQKPTKLLKRFQYVNDNDYIAALLLSILLITRSSLIKGPLLHPPFGLVRNYRHPPASISYIYNIYQFYLPARFWSNVTDYTCVTFITKNSPALTYVYHRKN
jgi:hypothetical protein